MIVWTQSPAIYEYYLVTTAQNPIFNISNGLSI